VNSSRGLTVQRKSQVAPRGSKSQAMCQTISLAVQTQKKIIALCKFSLLVSTDESRQPARRNPDDITHISHPKMVFPVETQTSGEYKPLAPSYFSTHHPVFLAAPPRTLKEEGDANSAVHSCMYASLHVNPYTLPSSLDQGRGHVLSSP